MKRALASAVLLSIFALTPGFSLAAWEPTQEMKTATVFIGNFDTEGNFRGWGSGFYVDEGIVVTNKHVLETGTLHRVYVTDANGSVDFDCYQTVTKSDVKINLESDVAYMRAYLPCEHGILDFANDAEDGERVLVLGYPFRGSLDASTTLAVTTGSVLIGETEEGWRATDAYLDIGSSGGPVLNEVGVVGVAVARATDDTGGYIEGYFIPSSTILDGLLYANDSDFGYTPRSLPSSLSRTSSSVVSSSSSSRSSIQSRSITSSFSASSARSSIRTLFPDVSPSHPAYSAILSLVDLGVISGYPDGYFRPTRGINRAEFIKILVAGFQSSALRNEKRCFSDVDDEWFAPYVCAAKRLGWISGYPDLTFKPSQSINRAEAMKILIAAFGEDIAKADRAPRDVRASAWYSSFVLRGVTIGIVDARAPFHPGDFLTREDAAVWIDGAVDAGED